MESNNIKHLRFIIKETKDITNHLQQKPKLSPGESFVLGLTERLNFSCKGMQQLIEKLSNQPELEFSIGIILRASLLDILIGLNLHRIVAESYLATEANEITIQKAEKFAEQILSDGLQKTLEYFKLSNQLGFLTITELEKKYQQIYEKYPALFNSPPQNSTQPTLKHTDFFAPSKLFKLLANSHLKNLSQLYDQYLFYSKYDHFGIQYMDFIRADNAFKTKAMTEAIQHLIMHLTNLTFALHMFSPNDFIKEKCSECESYVRTNYFN